MSVTTAPSRVHTGATAAVISALRTLDWRQLRILDKRTVAAEPVTLQTIADEIDRTRERVRQLERDALRHLREQLADDPHCADLLAEARHLIDPVACLQHLVDTVEGFADRAAPLNASVGRLLLAIDGIEVGERWAATPDIRQVTAYTSTLLAQSANRHGALRLQTAVSLFPQMPPSDAAAWISDAGATVIGPYVLTVADNQCDIAAALLSFAGDPMTPEGLMAIAAGQKWSVRSFRQRLQSDDRFVRTGKNHYALAEWGIEPYTTVVDAIGNMLDAAGGCLPLSKLTDDLSTRHGITKASIAAYTADNFHFQLRRGMVTRVAKLDAPATARRARAVYRRPNAWIHRVEVNSEHMRGSGFPVPTYLAAVTGMKPTEARQLVTPLGKTVTVKWRRQVEMGSIRHLLLHYGIEVGQQVFLIVGDDGSFDVELVRGTSALELMGAGTLGASDPWPRVAAALDMPGASPTELVRRLVLDGDSDVVAVLPTTGINVFAKHNEWTELANAALLNGSSIAEAGAAVGRSRQVVRERILGSKSERPAPVVRRAA